MAVTRKIRQMVGGKIKETDIGALAENVEQDENHRFVTDNEKKAWNEKPSKNGDMAESTVSTLEETQESFPKPVAGDNQKTLWGKLKKWQQDCIAKFGNYVLTSMIVNQHLNSTSNIPTSALVYLMQQAIQQNQSAINVLNTKANENGIVTPIGGTGNLNTYWASDGMLNYKVVNGLCIISFNINLKIPTQESVLITDALLQIRLILV